FNQPVPFYVENFIGFPVGTAVPVGYYDRTAALWKPESDGRVIAVLGSSGGLATLDVDGDGAADTGSKLSDLGISDAERAQLAALYPTPRSLWRVRMSHFSDWDCNWPYAPPADATWPDPDDPTVSGVEKNTCKRKGSVIECENQVLGERI